jgi:hypothetical protein
VKHFLHGQRYKTTFVGSQTVVSDTQGTFAKLSDSGDSTVTAVPRERPDKPNDPPHGGGEDEQPNNDWREPDGDVKRTSSARRID